TQNEWNGLANLEIHNSIAYGNGVAGIPTTTIPKNSLIQGRNVGDDDADGNISAAAITGVDDLFSDMVNGDFTLKGSSVIVDKGNNGLFPDLEPGTKDLAGNPRVYGASI